MVRGPLGRTACYRASVSLTVLWADAPFSASKVTRSWILRDPFCASAVCPFDVGFSVSVTLPAVARLIRWDWTSGFAVAGFA